MPEKFDPYYKWLGIAPKDQPPNHYRLLGIDLFEADADVIASAADQRMGHIRSFQTGRNADLSQKVLNEIAAARVCLLNPGKKAEYDQQLRQQMEPVTPAAIAPPAPPPPPPASPAISPDSLESEYEPLPIRLGRSRSKKPPYALWVVGAAGVAAVILIVIMAWSGRDGFFGNSLRKWFAASPPPPSPSPMARVEVGKPKPKEVEPANVAKPRLPKAKPRKVPTPERQQKTPVQAATPLREEIASASKPTLTEPPSDPHAAPAQVDLLDKRTEDLEKSATIMQTPSQRESLAKESLELLEEAFAADNFAIAQRLGKLALEQARLARNQDLLKAVVARSKLVEAAEGPYQDIRDALTTLAKSPTDPDANLTVGKYKCFVKGDWASGLPMLALGSDAPLKTLAELDRKEATSADGWMALGDAWWKVAEDEQGLAKRQIHARAAYSYRKALPDLKGAAKDRVGPRVALSARESGEELPKSAVVEKVRDNWMTIFRSVDPSIWDTNTQDGPDRFAVPLNTVPESIKYLRMQIDRNHVVILEIKKSQLKTEHADQTFGWNGTSNLVNGARHLGIYDKTRDVGGADRTRSTLVAARAGFTGCGFGHRHNGAPGQSYVWAGREWPPTVFEIAVKSEPLTRAEQKLLLK